MDERETLTGRQRDVYEAVRRLVQAVGRPVNLDEVANAADLHDRSAARKYVVPLEEKGYLRQLPGHRGIELVDRADAVRVYGHVACGSPLPAGDCEVERLDLNKIFGSDQFLLVRAKGDSMREAGILPGDVVAVRKTPRAEDGEIVLCSIDGEQTLKVLRRSPDGVVILHPCNRRARRIPLSAENENVVVGVYAGVIRLPK